ncbi:MAG: ScpA family protein [Halobacteriales archaeon]
MTDREVPLNIAGHERRDPPDDTRDGGLPGGDGGEGGATEATDPEVPIPDVEAPPDADEDAVQPVELLVNLAEDGEIDPWDIDVVVVTDKFLDRLDDADLQASGRALFYASVLLRMKGDALLGDDEQDEEPEPVAEPWEREPALDADFDPVDRLEDEMARRLDRKRVRGSPETLEELVHELRDVERRVWWKEARTYDTGESPSGFSRGAQTLDYRADDAARMGGEPTESEVTGRTHDEDIEAVIDDVRAALREQYDRGREEVLFAEIESAGGSRVLTYLALLFLAHRGHVALRQDDLFGDLWIRDRAAAAAESEAVAD